MAKSRTSKQPLFKGSTLFTLLFGLILGLGIAAGVAWFVTQVPMPFADKFSRSPPNTLLPDVRDAPDPNQGLMGRGGAGSPVDPAVVTPPKPLAESGQSPSLQDDIGALLTTLGAPQGGTTTAPSPAASAPRAESAAPAASAKPAPPQVARNDAPPAPAAQITYYLQAGAFRAQADAQAMQARILMLGMQSQVQPAQVNGTTLYRVRVGPFKGIDEMNRSRATLSNAKIDTSVVRP